MKKTELKTYLSVDFLRKLDKVDPHIKDLFISLADEIQRIANANKSDLDELNNVVRKPTAARKKKERKVRHNEKNIGN